MQSTTNRPWLALALLAAAQFVVVLDASIVNVALPTIGRDLGFSQEDVTWVVNAYALTFGGFLLLGGRLADLLGRRRMFVAGLWLFSVASLAGGFAQSELWLVLARGVQGLGAALLSPAALSLVTTIFAEGAERNKALGVWGAVAGSGGAAGVLLGGILTEGLSWEWVLWVNVPIGITAALLAPRLVGESADQSATRGFDLLGALSVTGGLSLLVYALVDANQAGWQSTQTVLLLTGAALLLIAFVAIELRSRTPLVAFSIFRLRTVTGANAVGVLTGTALFSMFFFITFYMQAVLGFDALDAGLAYLPLALSIIVAAGVAQALVTRIGFKRTMVFGLSLVAAGLLWFNQVSVDGSYAADVLGPAVLAGLGLGFTFVPLMVAAVSGVDHNRAGLASGLINTSQQVGGALGLAVLSAVANATRDDVLAGAQGDPSTMQVALTEGFQDAFLAGAGFALLAGLLALTLISSRAARAHRDAAQAGEVQPAAA